MPPADHDAPHRLVLPPGPKPVRLDKALAQAAGAEGLGLSRSRLAQLIQAGALRSEAGVLDDPSAKVKPGTPLWLRLPPPAPARPQPEAIRLDVIFEDSDLIVVDKPPGMVVHPAPGAETGTLVNALLAHCPDLAGIGGEVRPGIVHRIDKDTSGLLVVAKSQAAMTGLATQFADHSIHRRYTALLWGAPDRADPRLAGVDGVTFEGGQIRIATQIARHPADRKKMAVAAPPKGRHAITYAQIAERFGPDGKPFAALGHVTLETGRTHQIRVHAAHIGHALVGDPVYGRARIVSDRVASAAVIAGLKHFPRQALHAAELGFQHPITGQNLAFACNLPADLHELLTSLRRNG